MKQTIRSPLCIYKQHCGSRAVLGKGRRDRTIRCLQCKARGVRSMCPKRKAA